MKALLLAAGLGTRLKPLTDTMPKAMVPLHGKPLIAHTITRLLEEGATEIVVNVHHFASQIKDYLASQDWGVTIKISDESRRLLDTGGGLRQAATYFSPGDQPILIHNVDILSNAPLARLYQLTSESQAEAVLLVSPRPAQRNLLFDQALQLCGWTNLATGEVRPPHAAHTLVDLRRYAFSGIHCVTPRLIARMDDYPEAFPIIDFYLKECHEAKIQAHVAPDLRLLDVGKLDSLHEAEKWLET